MKKILFLLFFQIVCQAATSIIPAPTIRPVLVDTNSVIVFPLDFATANNLGGGGGSGITSLTITVPSFLTVTPGTRTTPGTFAFTLSGSALPITSGGTGGTTASAGRTALGLGIGSDIEAWSANLDAWSAIATSAKQDHSSNLDSWSALATSAKQDALGFTAVPNTRTVTAGAGLSGGGALSANITLTLDQSTFVNNITMWDGSQATRTWTASLSGATDPVWTYGNNSADLSTGVLKYGGNTVGTSANNLSFFAATTSAQLLGILSDETGTGAAVFANTPTLVTPVLGVATATSINGTTIPSSKTLTDTSENLSVFSATTSAQLAGVLSDETGTGLAVFATSPTLTTPTLGVATATSVNGTTIPASKTLVVTTDTLAVHAATTSAQLAGVISDETGSGVLVFGTSPTLITPTIGVATATSVNGTTIPSSKTLVVTTDAGTVFEAWSANLDLWSAVAPSAYLAKSIWTTKGDILSSTASATPARLGVGSNGQILIADSAAAGGLTWTNNQTISGGGGGGTSGTVINSGASVVSNVPRYTDTTGTNVAPSTILVDASGNVSALNSLAITNATATNGFNLTNGVATIYKGGIGVTATDGLVLTNNQVASAGAQQQSPSIHIGGQGWKTTATAGSQAVDFQMFVLPVQGSANPSSTFTLNSSINGGAYGNSLLYTSAGAMSVAASFSTGSGGITSGTDITVALANKLNWNGRSQIKSSADGANEFLNAAGTAPSDLRYGRLNSTKTSNYTVTALDSGTIFDNIGAAGAVTNTLPTAARGLFYEFYVDAAQTVTIVAGASTTIRYGATVTASAGNITSNAQGSIVRIVAISTTQWIVEFLNETLISVTGPWTFN